REREGIPDLTENLGLAEKHRLQSRGNATQVTLCLRTGECVTQWRDGARRVVPPTPQEAPHGGGRRGHSAFVRHSGVELDAVTGREDRYLLDWQRVDESPGGEVEVQLLRLNGR